MAKGVRPVTRQNPRLDQKGDNLPLDVEISHRLIREIIELKHVPGAWLREQEIAERFDVSRSPIREALRHVAKAGFVQMHPWRGAQIVELSEETTTQVFDMLEALYGVVARLSAQTMPSEKMPKLREFLRRGDHLAKPGVSMRERVAFSFEMGRYIGKWGTTPKTYEVFTHVGNLAMWQHRFMLTEDVFARRSMEIHHVMVSAIEARDPARAEWAARAIVDLSRDRILPNLPDAAGQTVDTTR
ncbi:MAG: GntR family transcriptional regulator [Hyphomonadaceae bacterium]|nr:GntR family transcriptional regulator [Hyphomonadaceae bacterium]